MIEADYKYGLEEIEEICNIRHEFIGDGTTYLSEDENAIHVLVCVDGLSIATGSLYQGEVFKINNVFVLKNYQKNGYGDLVVKMLLDKAFRLGAQWVFTNPPSHLIGFFERIGFVKDSISDAFKIKETMIVKCGGAKL